MTEKTCLGRCGQTLPLEMFSQAKKGKLGRATRCKGCLEIERLEKLAKRTPEQIEIDSELRRTRARQRYHDIPPSRALQKDKFLQITYKITLEEYEEMEKSQGFVCAICKNSCPSGRRLSVDHNHDTGQVRGLLCMPCNRGIGNLCDSAEILRDAADYLDKFNQ